MLTAITVVLNVASSVVLIVLVLLHSGKGGGLSDMFGGGMGASAMGSTVMERNLDRITVVVALIWGFTVVGAVAHARLNQGPGVSILGTRVARVEDPRLLTEGARYVADLREPALEGAVHATFVRSTLAHGRILGVDVDEARALPGVVDVVIGADLDLRSRAGHRQPGDGPPPARHRPGAVRRRAGGGRAERDARGRCRRRRVGGGRRTTRCPPSSTRSPRSTATRCCSPTWGRTSWPPSATRAGPTRPAGRRAARSWCAVASSTSAWRPCRSRGARRPRPGSTAGWCCGARRRTPTGCATPSPRPTGSTPAQVRVVAPDVGGGFGAKIGAHPEDLVLGWLARRCGRPVRWTETRTDNLTAMVHGRAQVQDVTIGGRRDGTIEAYHLDIVQDAGAYPAMAAFLPHLTRSMAAGTYAIPRVTSHATGRRHHHDPGGRVPRGRAARGDRRHRAGGRPVRGRGRPRPGRGAAAQPGARVRRGAGTCRPAPPTTAATSPAPSNGCSRPPATTSCGPSRPGAGRRGRPGCWASACRATSR